MNFCNFQCHKTRSLEQNRLEARWLLKEQLDVVMNGENSFLNQRKEESREWKQDKKKRARDKLSLKRAFKNKNEPDNW